jgi:hypothetical protein
MLTFFSTGKRFVGHDGIIQRNALKSWTLLHPKVEVILFGDELGAAEVCAELGLRHEPRVERYESRVPYVNFLFARAQQIARHRYLCYSNCDVIFLSDFWNAFERAKAWRDRFLLVGQRWDSNITEPIDFERPDWTQSLRQFALTRGMQQHANYIDFFLFPRGLYEEMPPLAVGHCGWDHWTVWKALSVGAAVLDVSPFVVPVHQNHGYSVESQRSHDHGHDPGSLRNVELAGKGEHLRSILDSTHLLTRRGKIRWTPLRRRIEEHPATAFLRQVRQSLLNKTFGLRRRVGLRRQSLRKIFRN